MYSIQKANKNSAANILRGHQAIAIHLKMPIRIVVSHEKKSNMQQLQFIVLSFCGENNGQTIVFFTDKITQQNTRLYPYALDHAEMLR